MNHSPSRSWRRMIRSVGDYRRMNISFRSMTAELKEALGEADIQDEALTALWHVHWMPLRDLGDIYPPWSEVDRQEAYPLVERMRRFLLDQESVWNPAPGRSDRGDRDRAHSINSNDR